VTLTAPELGLSFFAGIVSFLSPCTLPLVPGYLAAISGREANAPKKRFDSSVLKASGLFIGAFSLIFVIGGLGATALGSLLVRDRPLLEQVGGSFILAMGVYLICTRWLPGLGISMHSNRLLARATRGRPVACGAAFALAWTPCVGPTLGAILALSSTQRTLMQGAVLLMVYALGLGLPFLASALALSRVQVLLGRFSRVGGSVQVLAGLTLVGMGALVLSGYLFTLNVESQRILSALGLGFLNV
jgi:cytochrome c-type biogenesis protein